MISKKFLKTKTPKIYSVIRNLISDYNNLHNLDLIHSLQNENKKNFDSIISVPFFDYRKKIYEEDLKKSKNSFAYLEINNSCNINCVMCDTKSSTRKKKIMDLDLVESSLIKIKNLGIRKVSLHTIGDPLANKKIEEVFSLLRKYDMQTSLSSNGLMLKKNLNTLKRYIDVCSDIKFSIDGCTKDVYEKIRFGGKWEDLLANFEIALNELEPLGYRISVLNILMKENYHQAGEYINFFSKYFKYPHERVEFDLLNSLSPSNDFFFKNNLFDKDTYLNKFCTLVSNPIPFILVDGSLSVCCRDYDGSLIIGDTKKDSIDEIFESDKFKELQIAHSDKGSNSFSKWSLCNSCYIVDDRISFIFTNLVKMIILKFKGNDGFFFQRKIEKIVKFLGNINTHTSYIDFERELLN